MRRGVFQVPSDRPGVGHDFVAVQQDWNPPLAVSSYGVRQRLAAVAAHRAVVGSPESPRRSSRRPMEFLFATAGWLLKSRTRRRSWIGLSLMLRQRAAAAASALAVSWRFRAHRWPARSKC